MEKHSQKPDTGKKKIERNGGFTRHKKNQENWHQFEIDRR